jgi:hypothetical protein
MFFYTPGGYDVEDFPVNGFAKEISTKGFKEDNPLLKQG